MSHSPDSTSSESENASRPAAPIAPDAPTVTGISTEQTGESSIHPQPMNPGSSKMAANSTSISDDDQEHSTDDEKSTSPGHTSEKPQVLGEAGRTALREQARQLQANLLEIAESVELVKADHDKLEKQNLALQDYIGGLTRSMSQGQAPKGTRSSGK